MKHDYELWQGGVMVAATCGKDAHKQIMHYAWQYAEDGPVEVRAKNGSFDKLKGLLVMVPR